MGLSTSTIITLSVIFLIIMVLMCMRRTIGVAITALVISIIVVTLVQMTTVQVLVNLRELGEFVIDMLLRLFNFITGTAWPALGGAVDDVTRGIEQGLG